MPKKSTIRLLYLVTKANHMLANSTCQPAVRQGICSLIEWTLHESGQYAGFGYLNAQDMAHLPGEAPGIVRNPDNAAGPHTFPDETRRSYYYKGGR